MKRTLMKVGRLMAALPPDFVALGVMALLFVMCLGRS